MQCPKQPSNVECGYYIMRYMRDFCMDPRPINWLNTNVRYIHIYPYLKYIIFNILFKFTNNYHCFFSSATIERKVTQKKKLIKFEWSGPTHS